MDKATRQWVRDVDRYLGLAHRETGRGHVQILGPAGEVLVTTSGTTSDHRALKNATAQLKRAGYDLRAAKARGRRA
jgi:hypothetical protein